MTSSVLCLVFFRVLGWPHLAAIVAIGILLPLGVALRAASRSDGAARPALERGKAASPHAWFAVALFCAACAKFTVLGQRSSGFVPSLHDEWAYLFGAQTMARGSLSNDSPPCPEFFDSLHILTTPRWVTRYPPGHPAALALGVLIGWPWIVPVALTAGVVVWIYLLGCELGGEAVARLAAGLAFLSPGLDYIASGYLSQSTFLFALTGCYVCAIRSVSRSGKSWTVAAGVLGVWAILTRPYAAIALGIPLFVWFHFRVWPSFAHYLALVAKQTAAGKRPREFEPKESESATEQGPADADRAAPDPEDSPIAAKGNCVVVEPFAAVQFKCGAAGLFLVVAAMLMAWYNLATTGSAWRTTWGEYNRRFEPANTLGFGDGSAGPIPEGLDARKAEKARSIAEEKARFTPVEALRRALADPRRLSSMVFPSLGFYGLAAFIPFALARGRTAMDGRRGLAALLLAAAGTHYLAYSTFYSTWDVYGHETIPFLIVLAAAGLVHFWSKSLSSDRPLLALAAALAIVAALGMDVFVQIPGFIRQRREDTAYHTRFDAAVRRIRDQSPLLLFVRLDASQEHPYDLINNSPDPSARVLVVLDRGAENAKLVAAFPGRRAYVFDEASWAITPWVPEPRETLAKWSIHRAKPTLASPLVGSWDR